MVNIILNPPRDEINKFGPLAYVSKEERDRILAVPFGQFKPSIKRLEKAIAVAIKKAEKRK